MSVLTLALCARLSWLLVSFQVHIKSLHIIIKAVLNWVVCDRDVYAHRSSRHHCTYRQDWAAWRPCSCYCTMEQPVMQRPRISTLRCTLPWRRVMKMSWRFSLTVELNTTPSHGYCLLHLFHLYICYLSLQFTSFRISLLSVTCVVGIQFNLIHAVQRLHLKWPMVRNYHSVENACSNYAWKY